MSRATADSRPPTRTATMASSTAPSSHPNAPVPAAQRSEPRATFVYRALDVDGLESSGSLAAGSAEEVARKLGPYLQGSAVVGLVVREVNSSRIFVVGEVSRPGAYPLRSLPSERQLRG